MSVLFISDLHLEAKRPDITRALLSFLSERARRAKALYILGGFFETWVDDDSADAFRRPIAQSLRQVVDGDTHIYLMHSDRDFFIGKTFCHETGCTLLPDPNVINLYDESVLLMHGDSLCTRDGAYICLRRQLHNPLTLWVLRYLPLTTQHKLAHELRKESRAQTHMRAVDIIDVTSEEMPWVMRKHDVRTLIHGHTRQPAEHPLDIDGQSARHIVLDGWDRQDWALEVDANGRRQAPFPL